MKENSASLHSNPDSLVTMLRMAHSFENWDNVIRLSSALHETATRLSAEPAAETSDLNKPLVYYIGFSNLMKGYAYEKKKQYAEALACISRYQDLSPFTDGSPQSQSIAERFEFLAKANRFANEIMSGDMKDLNRYSVFLQQHPAETLSGLITVLDYANSYDVVVDDMISPLLDMFFETVEQGVISEQRTVYFSIMYSLAVYRFKNRRYLEAIDTVVLQLDYSDQTGDDLHFKKAMALFEEFRSHASTAQLERYNSILRNFLLTSVQEEEGFRLDREIIVSELR